MNSTTDPIGDLDQVGCPAGRSFGVAVSSGGAGRGPNFEARVDGEILTLAVDRPTPN